MAVVTTAFAPEARIFPWATVSKPDDTIVPRAEITFSVVGGAVTVSGVGDTQEVEVTCTLPRNYAYVLADLFYSVALSETNLWPASSSSLYRAQAGPPVLYLEAMSENLVGGGNWLNMRSYRLDDKPTLLLKTPDSTAVLQSQIHNSNTAQPDAFLWYFARFYMYDFDQANRWEVNTPLLTR